MFKGLKSKLEDEAKRIQQTVSQYSENIVQHVRASPVSEIDEINPSSIRTIDDSKSTDYWKSDLTYSDLYNKNDIVSDNSAVLQEVSEFDLLSQPSERRDSTASVESNESSLNSLFASIPGMLALTKKLNVIVSDEESESYTNSSHVAVASKEQISSILHKLQGRTVKYKDKFRNLSRAYNDLIRENEKFKELLTSTQDKAIERVEKLRSEKRILAEKLEELDEKLRQKETPCKESIEEAERIAKLEKLLQKSRMNMKENQDKIAVLIDENKKLKNLMQDANDDEDISNLAVQRVTSEWKARVNNIETEWARRLRDVEEQTSLMVAKSKAEMHSALEEKEHEVQAVRSKCKQMDLKELEMQKQSDELQSTIEALESEKAEMIEKLSEAKHHGVKAVRVEEENKRNDLRKEYDTKREKDRLEYELKLQKEIRKIEIAWQNKLKEREEQMEWAIEEREMQKAVAVMKKDRLNDDFDILVDRLTAEKLKLVTELDDVKRKSRHDIDELNSTNEKATSLHKIEIGSLKQHHYEVLSKVQQELTDSQIENEILKKKLMEKESRSKLTDNVHMSAIAQLHSTSTATEYSGSLRNNAQLDKEDLHALKADNGMQVIDFIEEVMNSGPSISGDYDEIQNSVRNADDTATFNVVGVKTFDVESGVEYFTNRLSPDDDLFTMHEHVQEQLNVIFNEAVETEKKYMEIDKRYGNLSGLIDADIKNANNEGDTSDGSNSLYRTSSHVVKDIEYEAFVPNEPVSQDVQSFALNHFTGNPVVVLSNRSLEDLRNEYTKMEAQLMASCEERNELLRELETLRVSESFLKSELHAVERESAERLRQEQNSCEKYAKELEIVEERCIEFDRILRDSEALRKEKHQLLTKLASLEEELSKRSNEAQQDIEKAIEETKKKAELDLIKMRKTLETECHATKAELILQIDQARSEITNRDEKVDQLELSVRMLKCGNVKELEIAKLECEKLMNDLSETKSILDDARMQIDVEKNRAESLEEKFSVSSKENEELRKKLDELEKIASSQERKNSELIRLKHERSSLVEQVKADEDKLSQLKLEYNELEKVVKDCGDKAKAKAEVELNRRNREHLKEMKKLYHELNECKSQLSATEALVETLRAANGSMVDDSEALASIKAHVQCMQANADETIQIEFEELQSLREQVTNYQNEINQLNAVHESQICLTRHEALLAARAELKFRDGNKAAEKHIIKSGIDVSYLEPTETEYLRNILFRYMSERETLGREIVTLARVLGKVAKFSEEQLEAVVAKEEHRVGGWYGDGKKTVAAHQSQNLLLGCMPPVKRISFSQ